MITEEEEEEEEERGVLDIEVDNDYKEMMNLITSEDEKGAEGKYNDLFLLSSIGDNSDQISDDLLFTDINGTG